MTVDPATSPSHPDWIAVAQQASIELGAYPKDEGWRGLYRLIAAELADPGSPVTRALVEHFTSAPSGDPAHVISVLGFAIKQCAGQRFHEMLEGGHQAKRQAVLRDIVAEHAATVARVLSSRRNSFTSTRRFLVPQVIFSRYFGMLEAEARLLDIGTGLGLLPRQINSRRCYETFAPSARWPSNTQPRYLDVPLAARLGIDRPPFPDLEWVRACYGESDYYMRLFGELLWTLDLPEVRNASVRLEELDLLRMDELASFITEHEVNAVSCSYVLYELPKEARSQVVATVVDSMPPPGLLIVIDPRPDVGYRGAVTLHEAARRESIEFATVGDRHFVGMIRPGPDYEDFASRYLPDLV